MLAFFAVLFGLADTLAIGLATAGAPAPPETARDGDDPVAEQEPPLAQRDPVEVMEEAFVDALAQSEPQAALDDLERALQAWRGLDEGPLKQAAFFRLALERARLSLALAELSTEQIVALEQDLEEARRFTDDPRRLEAAQQMLAELASRRRSLEPPPPQPSLPPRPPAPRLRPSGEVQLTGGRVEPRGPLLPLGVSALALSSVGFAMMGAGMVLGPRAERDLIEPTRRDDARQQARTANVLVATGASLGGALLVAGTSMVVVALVRRHRHR